MSSEAERRKFFLGVIDHMAGTRRLLEALKNYRDKPDPWQKTLAGIEKGELDDDREPSPESDQERVERESDTELLRSRRYTAESICMAVVDPGCLYYPPMHELLLSEVERLRIMDVELNRRGLDRGQATTD
jgi:hypothetical protein